MTKTDFGTLNTTVELGAGWVYDSDEAREFLQLTKEYGVDIVQSDYFDFASAAYVYNDDTAVRSMRETSL